jgi:predicted PurR-regulated permease PerM
MERGGAGTAILLILFLLIMVVLLFPNQVEQFLKQFNISLGNGTSNSSQSSQQITNGSQNSLNISNVSQNSSSITSSNQTYIGGGGGSDNGRYLIR